MTDITMPIVATLPPRASSRVADFAPRAKPVATTAVTLPETIAAVLAENVDLKERLSTSESRRAAGEAAITMMESNINASDSRANSCVAERDKAVSDYAELKGKYEALFHAVKLLLDNFVPAAEAQVKEFNPSEVEFK